MPDAIASSEVIAALMAELRPTRRLPSPWRRTVLLLGAWIWLAVLLSVIADLPGLWLRLASAPDMYLGQVGAMLTTVLSALASLQIAIPGRRLWWAAAPLPALALCVGASATGCLRLTSIAGVRPEPALHPIVCSEFLLLASAPIAVLMTLLLARAYPLRPFLTAALAGLASAAAGLSLLALNHPYDANAGDLLVHAAVASAIVAVTCICGGKACQAATAIA